MKQYYVYILKCSDGSYYTGITSDVEKRLRQHYESENPDSYVTTRKPFTLVFVESFNDVVTAIEREKQIKGWSRKKKEALINSCWEKLKELSICRNETHFSNA